MRTIWKTTETHAVQASWQAKKTNPPCVIRGRRISLRCQQTANMPRANLQPRAICRTSTSIRPSSKVGIMPMSANKRRKLLSVMCSSSSDEVMSQQGGSCSRLETEIGCVRSRVSGTSNHKYICIEQLGVTENPKSHVTAAMSCCLEMAL